MHLNVRGLRIFMSYKPPIVYCLKCFSKTKNKKSKVTLPITHVLSAKTFPGHLILRVLLLLLFVGLLIYLVFPLFFWLIFGESASADRISEKPTTILIADLLPLLLGIVVCFYQFIRKSRKGEASKAKSYLLAGLVLLMVYPFRMPIINAAIEACLYISDRL
jgi:hypothetical protein